MFFASDNAGPAHPEVLQALVAANDGYAMAYGADALTEKVQARIREIFEAPEAAVYLVGTGTAANSLALATLARPWQTIFCTPVAHVHTDECNAPEFFTGGAKLTPVGGDDRMTAAALEEAVLGEENRGVHGPQRGPVTITQATERGGVYSLAEIAAIGQVARAFGLPVHMDGARFANALVALGATPAEMTWKAGIDAVSFGATKNGCPGAEAVIFFDPAHGWEFELRRKRAGHLFSKHRYLAAQMLAYLEGDLWLASARAANAAARRLARGMERLGVPPDGPVEANIVFAALPRRVHRALHEAGAQYHLWGGSLEGGPDEEALLARFVCDWSIREEDIAAFLAALETALQ